MDRNIYCTRLPSQFNFLNLDTEEDLVELKGYKSVFPHIVLTIRWDGDAPRWLEELNGSHLVERISGFSMYPQAVATLVPSSVSKLPFWVFLICSRFADGVDAGLATGYQEAATSRSQDHKKGHQLAVHHGRFEENPFIARRKSTVVCEGPVDKSTQSQSSHWNRQWWRE
jgi:hypothetical protein